MCSDTLSAAIRGLPQTLRLAVGPCKVLFHARPLLQLTSSFPAGHSVFRALREFSSLRVPLPQALAWATFAELGYTVYSAAASGLQRYGAERGRRPHL